MSKVDVDDSEIKSITGISVSEVSGDFSSEWLSCTFIENVIKEINSLISNFNEVKSEANNYPDTNEVISNQPEPNVPSSTGGGDSSHSSSKSSDGAQFQISMGGNFDNLIIKSVPMGTKITIIEVDNGSGWTKIKLEDGTEGYILTQNIQIEKDTNSGLLIQTTNVLSSIPSNINNYSSIINNGVNPSVTNILNKVSSSEGEETL